MKLLAAVTVVLVACKSSPAAQPPGLVDLSASLDAVRGELDAHRGEPRFLALLAPT